MTAAAAAQLGPGPTAVPGNPGTLASCGGTSVWSRRWRLACVGWTRLNARLPWTTEGGRSVGPRHPVNLLFGDLLGSHQDDLQVSFFVITGKGQCQKKVVPQNVNDLFYFLEVVLETSTTFFFTFGGLPVHSQAALISMQDLRATSSYIMTFQAFVFLNEFVNKSNKTKTYSMYGRKKCNFKPCK